MVEKYAVLFGVEPDANLALARELALQALTLDDKLAESHFAMAGVLALSEDYTASIAAYHRTLQLEPQNGYAWCELSFVLNNEDPVAAEAAARKAISFRPAYSTAYFTLGASLQKQQRRREAIAAFRQSLLLDPNSQFLQGQIGQLYFELGDYAEALVYLEKLEPTSELREQVREARQALAN